MGRHRWDRIRDFVEPKVREVLDRFNDALFWPGLEETTGFGSGLPEQPCTWDADLLLWCPPDHVPLIAGWWRQAAPQLEVLREPFTRHAAEPGGWITTFESFADLVTDWGRWSRRQSAADGASSACAASRHLCPSTAWRRVAAPVRRDPS
ncbi:hypothetical protein [Streptomyces herbicida]|uniref:hypothetical protein n=1 Tax=Streptomyces herbicida TaxID=3065675 RepID=UPI002931EAE6|nr:hypothetical protein [Streptomyces sp. NEAU-HV9]